MSTRRRRPRKGAAAVGTLMTTSTVSNLSMEEIASHNPGPKWFQLYVPTDRGYTRELLQRAKAAGYTAIAPTVDNVWSYPREENIRNVFRPPSTLGRGNLPRGVDPGTGAKMLNARKRDLDWKDLEWIKQESGLPVMPKGVQSAKAATMAVKIGLDAVWVSNHGGRAFDGVQATITVLPRIAQAVDGRIPIVFDSGIRRADHVFKALALGRHRGRHGPADHVWPGARRRAGRAERARACARQFDDRDAARRQPRTSRRSRAITSRRR